MNKSATTYSYKTLCVLVFLHLVIHYWFYIPFLIDKEQYSFMFFDVSITWNVLLFSLIWPFTFLISDLTVRVFDASLAKKVVFFVVPVSFFIDIAFEMYSYRELGWESLFGYEFLSYIKWQLFRLTGHLIAQIINISLFCYLLQRKSWWVATMCSTLAALAFEQLAYFNFLLIELSDADIYQVEYMMEFWLFKILKDIPLNVVATVCLLVPIYGALVDRLAKKYASDSNSSIVERA